MVDKEKKVFFKDVQPRLDVDEMERGVLEYWEKEKLFEKSLEQRKDAPLFTFYDGPPYATGKPHYGHILQSAIKDSVLRYKTMQGYNVPRRVGWDCHGLPVETLVEKELGFKSKKDIEEFGIDKFNQKCRETVFRYIDDFTATLKRMGRWADYDNAYATLDRDYMESEWWAFKQLWDKDLVYKAFRSTPYCIRCATPLSNFEVSMAYKDKTDTAVYVKLRVKETAGTDQKLSLLIWTTTPWTLPGNTAVAYSTDESVKYVVVKHEGESLVMAKDRVQALLGENVEIKREVSREEMVLWRYEPLYPEAAQEIGIDTEKIYRLVPAEHVNVEDGTGLVHMAPAFGEEDAIVGEREGLPVLRTVDTAGKFVPEVKGWGGRNIFEANSEIVKDLEERGLLLKEEQYTHSYPFCWRCDEPLIYYALDSWFVKVKEVKDRMLEFNADINWIPEHIKKGRFAKGIEMAPDWAVSRNRYWSVPIPVWECDGCGERVCAGSLEELKELSGEKEIKDMHRPVVDGYSWKCASCEGQMKRVSEVLDVWFDSACMPYSQWHYPFENKELVEGGFPADFIAEAIDQTRAWFYVLHVVATALKDSPAYKNVIASGLIFAEDGQKLSKKLKNYPEPEPTIAKYGADALRLYLLASTSLGEPYRFSEKELQQLQRNVLMTLWNVYSFFVRYANTHGWNPEPDAQSENGRNLLDRWIVARLAVLERDVIGYADGYRIDQAARSFVLFVDDLSNWYVRRSRNRFQRPDGDAEEAVAFGTLYEVLLRTCKLLAPFAPFMAEEMYRNLTGRDSVHLEKLPASEEVAVKPEEEEALQKMRQVREVVAEGLALRSKTGLKIRQPLTELVVMSDINELSDEYLAIIREEVNVKKVVFGEKGGGQYAESVEDARLKVALNIEITHELKLEGVARDVIRHGQQLRRQAGYALDERINVVYRTESELLKEVLQSQGDTITNALQADAVLENIREDGFVDIKIDGEELHLGVSGLNQV